MNDKSIPVTYVLFPDEGHGFARPENSLAFYAVTEAFLAKHLGGRYEPIGDAFKGADFSVPSGKDRCRDWPQRSRINRNSRERTRTSRFPRARADFQLFLAHSASFFFRNVAQASSISGTGSRLWFCSRSRRPSRRSRRAPCTRFARRRCAPCRARTRSWPRQSFFRPSPALCNRSIRGKDGLRPWRA